MDTVVDPASQGQTLCLCVGSGISCVGTRCENELPDRVPGARAGRREPGAEKICGERFGRFSEAFRKCFGSNLQFRDH